MFLELSFVSSLNKNYFSKKKGYELPLARLQDKLAKILPMI